VRKYRDVDATAKWMKTAVSEEMIVPALASAVIAEIEAQAAVHAEQEIEISARGVSIAGLEKEVGSMHKELELIYCLLREYGLKDKVAGILEKNEVVPSY